MGSDEGLDQTKLSISLPLALWGPEVVWFLPLPVCWVGTGSAANVYG